MMFPQCSASPNNGMEPSIPFQRLGIVPKDEVVDTGMEELIIGEDNDFRDKQD